MSKIVIKTQVPLTNWYIEEFVRTCGYCELYNRKFSVYSSKRFCEFELFIKIPRLKVIFLKHDINCILKEKFGQKIKKAYKIEKARE